MKNTLILIFLLFPCLLKAQIIHIAASADTVCIGDTVNFLATDTGVSIAYYQWWVNGTIIFSGASDSTFTSDTLSNGDTIRCLLTNPAGDTVLAASNTIIITVQSMPFAGTITGYDTVCQKATTILSDTIPGGVWSAQNNNASVVGGTVTGVFADPEGFPTTDSIFYTVTNACGTDVASVVVLINPLPDAAFYWGTLDGPICVDEGMFVNDGDGVEGILYSLHGDVYYGSFDGEIFGVHAGTDTLISIATNECGSDTFTIQITVLPAPQLGNIVIPSNNICVGDTMTLIDTGSIGTTLDWNTAQGNVTINEFTGLVTGVHRGLDEIDLILYNQCGPPLFNSVTINVASPFPITDITGLCVKGSTLLSDSSKGGTWSSRNTDVATVGAASGMVEGLRDGVATITYTLAGGCYDTAEVQVTTCGNELVIFPNPSKDEVTIQVINLAYTSFSFIDILGQVVLKQPLTGYTTQVNIQLLPPGLYFIKVVDDNNNQMVSKFVKE